MDFIFPTANAYITYMFNWNPIDHGRICVNVSVYIYIFVKNNNVMDGRVKESN